MFLLQIKIFYVYIIFYEHYFLKIDFAEIWVIVLCFLSKYAVLCNSYEMTSSCNDINKRQQQIDLPLATSPEN